MLCTRLFSALIIDDLRHRCVVARRPVFKKWPAAREMSWPAAACASINETSSDCRHPKISTNFLYTQRPPRLRRHTIPQRADRQSIASERSPARDARHQTTPAAHLNGWQNGVSLLLAISDPRYPKDAEPGAAAKGTAGSDKTAATSRRVA
jgi:hypothetical protein